MDLFNDVNFVRSLIATHAYHPENKKDEKDDLTGYCQAKTTSATCTDNITVVLKIENHQIVDAKYVGIGCAISTATTDMLLNAIKNKTEEEALQIAQAFVQMTIDGTVKEELNDLQIFKNVYKQANRISCAQTGALSIEKILKK